jgi:hypothetical protein
MMQRRVSGRLALVESCNRKPIQERSHAKTEYQPLHRAGRRVIIKQWAETIREIGREKAGERRLEHGASPMRALRLRKRSGR